MNREKFLKDLEALEAAFQKLAPELELTVRDPELGVEGYVVVSSTLAAVGGPLGRFGKGGTRVTPKVDLDEIRMLARIMTLKNAAAGLPLGGAKSGLKADPTAPDFEIKFRRFVNLVKAVLVENGGLWGGFGFDIGMQTAQLIWACEETKSTRCATGKPIELGGTDYDKEGIAGLGVVVAAATALTERGEDRSAVRFAVQGTGAMGAAVIKYFSEYGATLCAVSDPRLDGGFRLAKAPSKALLDSLSSQNFESSRSLLAAEGEKIGSVEEVLFQECDILFPCAVQEVINDSNVDKIKARYLVEGANNPCVGGSRQKLHGRGVLVIPDFIANPGGIIAAYVEMSSPVTPEENAKTKKKVVEAKSYTKEKITANTKQLLANTRDYGVTPFEAGRYMALSAVFKNVKNQ